MRGLFGWDKPKSGQNPTPTQEEYEKNMVKVGDKWWPRGMISGHDIYYDEPKEKAMPLIQPNARSFGNERPPIGMRKPPTNEGANVMKYRTKPRDVEAMQYTGENFQGLSDFVNEWIIRDKNSTDAYLMQMDSLEVVHAGSWVVKYEEDDYEVYENEDFKDCFEPM